MEDWIERCEHYMVRTTFTDYNEPDMAGTKTYTRVRQEICKHPNIDKMFGPNGRRKIDCEGDSKKCLLRDS